MGGFLAGKQGGGRWRKLRAETVSAWFSLVWSLAGAGAGLRMLVLLLLPPGAYLARSIMQECGMPVVPVVYSVRLLLFLALTLAAPHHTTRTYPKGLAGMAPAPPQPENQRVSGSLQCVSSCPTQHNTSSMCSVLVLQYTIQHNTALRPAPRATFPVQVDRATGPASLVL